MFRTGFLVFLARFFLTQKLNASGWNQGAEFDEGLIGVTWAVTSRANPQAKRDYPHTCFGISSREPH